MRLLGAFERFGVADLAGLGEEERDEKPKEEFDNFRKELGSMRRKRCDFGRLPAGTVLFVLLRVFVGGMSWEGGIQGAKR